MSRFTELLATPDLLNRINNDDKFYELLLEEGDKALREQGHHSGVPLCGFDVKVIGKTNDPSHARLFDENITTKDEEPDPTIRNSWMTSRPFKGFYGRVVLKTGEDGKVEAYFSHEEPPHASRLNMWLETAGRRNQGCRLKAEQTAQRKLRSLLSRQQWRTYQLEGTFVERSKRSGLIYFLRRSRPTVAMREHNDWCHTLSALCLHPDGYYEGTWAGVMAPSDEVVAHLLHIRGDEYKYWKEANHIPIDDPRSGV